MTRWLISLLRLIRPCPHSEMPRERDPRSGVLMFRCACGYSQPVLTRTPEEQAAFRFDRPSHERLVAKKTPAQVIQMKRRAK